MSGKSARQTVGCLGQINDADEGNLSPSMIKPHSNVRFPPAIQRTGVTQSMCVCVYQTCPFCPPFMSDCPYAPMFCLGMLLPVYIHEYVWMSHGPYALMFMSCCATALCIEYHAWRSYCHAYCYCLGCYCPYELELMFWWTNLYWSVLSYAYVCILLGHHIWIDLAS